MKRRTPCAIVIIQLAIVLFVATCWIVNLVKFTKCDFESPYKSEVIHGVGVFTVVASVVTVWFPTEEEKLAEKN